MLCNHAAHALLAEAGVRDADEAEEHDQQSPTSTTALAITMRRRRVIV